MILEKLPSMLSLVFILGMYLAAQNATSRVHTVIIGKVLDAAGKPAPQYPVQISGGGIRGTRSFVAVTNSKGEFQLFDLAPGKYVIHPLMQPSTVGTSIEVTRDSATTTNLGSLKLNKTITR
jgi:hypothetical protein